MENLETKNPFLVFSEGISYGHIIRSLIFSKWLKKLNHSIIIACTDASSSLFREEGFETVQIQIAEPRDIYRRLCEGMPMYTMEELVTYFKRDDYLIKKIRPKLIISEFRFTALQLAKNYGIPSVSMIDATCHPNFIHDKSVPDPFVKSNRVPLWFLDFIAQKTVIGDLINRRTVGKISITFKEASQAYGLEPLSNFFEYASQGDICLICDHPNLVPIKPLRSGDIYTGALIWERLESLPKELLSLNKNTKTVYICPGTQESLSTSFLLSYIKQLLQQNLQVVVSRGKRNFNLQIQQKNLFIFDFVNENKLLPLVDVMVYPGGAMSTYQALYSGIPLIVLPAHSNQHFYGQIINNNNLGYSFRPSRLKISKLVEYTIRLLNDKSIHYEVKKIQKKLSNFDNLAHILSAINNLL